MRKKRSLPASATHGAPDPTKQRQNKSEAWQELRKQTYDRTIEILQARERREGSWSREQRDRARLYLMHLLTGGPLGIRTPSDVKLAVDAAFKQAREETGFTPLRPQPQSTKERRKRRR